MLAANGGQGSDHFRFEPQAEPHFLLAARLTDLAQTVRKSHAARVPIAGACCPGGGGVAFVGPEPPGIDDENFATEALRQRDERQQSSGVRLAEVRVPAVELHWN